LLDKTHNKYRDKLGAVREELEMLNEKSGREWKWEVLVSRREGRARWPA
jgi:hypothetical protein